MGQRLGLLGRELEALADRLGGTEIEDEGEDLHLGATEGAQQRVDLVEAMNPSEAMVYIDRPVSNSGRLAELVRRTAVARGSCLEATTADRVDERLQSSTAVVASADSAILDRCSLWLNLACIAVESLKPERDPFWLLDLS